MVSVKPGMRNAGGVALAVFVALYHQSAYAQQADGDSKEELTVVVVTGSRINASGFSAPTPTTMISAEDLQKSAQPNIFSAITKLPSLMGSTGVTTGTNSTSSGTQGLSSFALRGLGTIRTLTLLDGQRVVARTSLVFPTSASSRSC